MDTEYPTVEKNDIWEVKKRCPFSSEYLMGRCLRGLCIMTVLLVITWWCYRPYIHFILSQKSVISVMLQLHAVYLPTWGLAQAVSESIAGDFPSGPVVKPLPSKDSIPDPVHCLLYNTCLWSLRGEISPKCGCSRFWFQDFSFTYLPSCFSSSVRKKKKKNPASSLAMLNSGHIFSR